MPPVKMRGDGRKAKNPKKTLARLLGYMGKYRGTLIVVALCGVFSAVGSHEELMKSSHIYREVYDSQQKGVAQ